MDTGSFHRYKLKALVLSFLQMLSLDWASAGIILVKKVRERVIAIKIMDIAAGHLQYGLLLSVCILLIREIYYF